MHNEKRPMLIVTVGPSTNTEEHLRELKDKGVDFVRVNMSHSSLNDLEYFIKIAKRVDMPFIVDTEGSQIRTGRLVRDNVKFKEGQRVKICNQHLIGDGQKISLDPEPITRQLEVGDLIFLDFDAVVLKVLDTATIDSGFISADVVTGGTLGSNKAANVVSDIPRRFKLPVLTEKDKKSIELGLKTGIGHIALSFVRRPEDIDELRRVTKNRMRIISKIESKESLENLAGIIEKSDALLIDRGDLSKEVPIETVPFLQKTILEEGKRREKDVFIATNLLESMVKKKRPTMAEVNDIVNTILDGAGGLILSAETAIGAYPFECIDMINKIIKHSTSGYEKPRLMKDIVRV